MKWKVWMIYGALAIFAFGNWLAPKKVFSEAENRYLQEKPKLEAKAVKNGSYMETFETWMSDQLLFRDELVSLHASLDWAGGKNDSGGVYIGKDGYLLEMFTEMDERQLEKNSRAVGDFLERAEQQGISGHCLLVPTAGAVLQEKLPTFAPEIDQEALFSNLSQEIPGYVDVLEELRLAAKEDKGDWETQLYYKTDHHWTSLGAYYAYKTFAEASGREVTPLYSYTFSILSSEFYGTSYAKAGLYQIQPDVMTKAERKIPGRIQVDYGAEQVEASLYDETFLKKRDKYRVYMKGNYPLTKIYTEAENEEKLLLVKDSYGNTFVQYLLEDFEEIHVVDLRYFHQDLEIYMEEAGITEVLFLYQIKNFSEDTELFRI